MSCLGLTSRREQAEHVEVWDHFVFHYSVVTCSTSTSNSWIFVFHHSPLSLTHLSFRWKIHNQHPTNQNLLQAMEWAFPNLPCKGEHCLWCRSPLVWPCPKSRCWGWITILGFDFTESRGFESFKRLKVKGPLESRTSPTFLQILLCPLATYPDRFLKIHRKMMVS